MKVIYTDQSFDGLHESLTFLIEEQGVSIEKVSVIKEQLLDRADSLANNPHIGQLEEYLEHLEEGHRRLVEGNFKIIYKIKDEAVYTTDFFDSRQDPAKMKG